MSESTFEKIVRKSGVKPVECKCKICKTQCEIPLLGVVLGILEIF